MGAVRVRLPISALAAVGALLLAACSGPAEQVRPTDPATTVPPVVVVDKAAAPAPVIPPTWPLTGVEGGQEVRPAISVKIENSRQARPQTGLEQADVVWEQMVEGGETRFNAVFHSTIPTTVGPIRSVRPMDAAIAGPLGGIIVFSGGQGGFVQEMRDAGLQVLSNDEGADGMYRASDRRAPHNVYGTMADFYAADDGQRTAPPPQQFVLAPTAAESSAEVAGAPASHVDATFPAAKPSWDWDAGTGKWVRNESGDAAISADGVRLSATNVVIMRVDVRDTGTVDPAGAPVPETVLEGTGEVWVLGGGKAVKGTWSKGGTKDPVVLTAEDGTPILLAPGNSWVELVPNAGGNVTIS